MVKMDMADICIVLPLASINNWHLHQFDVSNVYLHGELSKEVYMVIPPDTHDYKPYQCCKLLKSLYDLKQASLSIKIEVLTLLLSSCMLMTLS